MRTITRSEITVLMSNAGIAANFTKCSDDAYYLPTERWLSGEFSASLIPWFEMCGLARDGKSIFEEEIADCEDFASAAVLHARRLHRLTVRARNMPRFALAFGQFEYNSDTLGTHAINVAIVRRKGEPTPIFYEPQMALLGFRYFIGLSENEKRNTDSWRI